MLRQLLVKFLLIKVRLFRDTDVRKTFLTVAIRNNLKN